MSFVGGVIVPTMPHPLLAANENEGYGRLREAYATAAARIAALAPDVLVLYSTRWPTVIGHQLQANPEAAWTHVDQEFHALGSIPYRLHFDPELAAVYRDAGRARGLHVRTVSYKGFPIDTGTITALKLLDPKGQVPAVATSCNMYADRAETLILGKAAADAIASSGKRAVAVAVTNLSNRWHTRAVPLAEDRISSMKDDEWNRKLLEFLDAGRLEDVSQLARTFTAQAFGDSKLKAIWWLAAAMGQTNSYTGEVLAYEPVWGAGCTVTWLTPADRPAADLEFDEDDVEVYRGERNVLATDGDPGASVDGALLGSSEPLPAPRPRPAPPAPEPAPKRTTAPEASTSIRTDSAPRPVGPYPHARREGPFLFLSGMGPRQPGTDAIPGGPIRDADGNALDYDVKAQTRAVIENIERVLAASGARLDQVVDITCFLVDMDRDFASFNEVYREHFADIGPTRTTVAVRALPTPIAVELKVVARVDGA